MKPRLNPNALTPQRSHSTLAKTPLLTLALSLAIALYGLSVLGSLIW